MFKFVSVLVYFLLGIRIIFLFCSIYLKRMENMNKETGIKSICCNVQIQFRWKKWRLVITDVTEYLIELMKIDSA